MITRLQKINPRFADEKNSISTYFQTNLLSQCFGVFSQSRKPNVFRMIFYPRNRRFFRLQFFCYFVLRDARTFSGLTKENSDFEILKTFFKTFGKLGIGFFALVIDEQEIVVINRRGREDVALVSASELSSLLETAHLLRSPKNAQRLLKALHRALAKTEKPETLEKLREEFEIEK